MTLKDAARNEIRGLATDDDLERLNEDLVGWNDALGDLYREATEGIMAAKTVYLSRGKCAPAAADFNAIKSEYVKIQNKIMEKKKLLKEIIRESTPPSPPKTHNSDILTKILTEIEWIRNHMDKSA